MIDADAADLPVIDVRTIPHAERHPRIFGVLKALKPDQGFIIVSDHAPRPLHYQIQANYPGLFDWEYLQEGPEVWRVRISREAESGCECCCGS